jgi:hypothetical protein
MSTQPQTEEYLAARRESCRLLGLNVDDLTPHETIRADLATVLRLWLDGSQSALLAGGNADPVKLLSVVEALTKLVPETEHKSRSVDPRAAMLETYIEMRRRGELADPTSTYDGLKAEVERLRARVVELEAAGAPTLDEPAPAPLPPNVTPLTRPSRAPTASPPTSAVPAPSKPTPPQAAPARSHAVPAPSFDYADAMRYVRPDGSISPRPLEGGGGKYWGPI